MEECCTSTLLYEEREASAGSGTWIRVDGWISSSGSLLPSCVEKAWALKKVLERADKSCC